MALHRIPADASDPSSVTKHVDAITSAFGHIDVLVNSAGIMRRASAEAMSIPMRGAM